MKTLRRFFRRLASWCTRERHEERIRAEIEEHLALQTADNIRAGLSPAEARRQAVLRFGGVEAILESCRDQSRFRFLEALLQDARLSLRRLRMAPAFTLSAVLTLALGIGATTSIFTLVRAVLLKSLPVVKPGELYRLGAESRCCFYGGYSQDEEFSLVSYDLYKYLRDRTKGFVELAAFPAFAPLFGIRSSGSSESAQSEPGEFVSGNYFAMFGLQAFAGRLLADRDDRHASAPVAVISHRLWQERYNSDPSVIGTVFYIDDRPFTIIGVTPPGFYGDTLRNNPPDIFLPLTKEPYVEADADLNKYDTHWLELIGRIEPGANPASVEAEMRVELKQWLRAHWGEMSARDRAKFPEQTLFLRPGGAGIASMREKYEHWLLILMFVTGFVLLIVCANLANLMLVRGLERRRQTSLSMALGARPSRLVIPPLIESILLSLLGGAAGLAIAFAGTRLILHLAFPSSFGGSAVPISASPSLPVLLFAFLASLATGISFGIAPAWMATRADPIEALRGSNRSIVRVASIPRKTLVVFQAALSLVLLSAAGLLTTAFERLAHQDLGFQQNRRLVVNIEPRLAGYQTAQLPLLYRRIHDAIATLPGVSSVALSQYSPFSRGAWSSAVRVDGHAPGPNDDYFAFWDRVSANYFETIGTPIVKGRGIADEDTASSPKIAVVNEAFTRKFFPNEDPIGKLFGVKDPRQFEIVGVVKNARYFAFNLDQPIGPFYFLPEAQADYTQANTGSLFLHDLIVLPHPAATVSSESIRQAMASIDPNLPVISVHSLEEQVAGQFTQQRLIARLTSFFGILALILASIGLYGVTAYNASRRASEIGVRIALGANRSQVIRMVVRGALKLILCGLLLGLPLTLAAARFLTNQLYGINPYDPLVTLAAVVALGFSSLIASFVPALRASSISPLDALRAE